MEQFIFIGVIVLFAILDGIAKKKKKEAQARGEEPDTPTPEELDWKWEPAGESLPAYEDGSSFDDQPEDDYTPTLPPPGGSQGIIPKNVWEEIAALASGRLPPQPEPAPPVPVVAAERRPTRGPDRPEHRAHVAHSKYGTPVSERLQPMDTPEMHQVRGFSPEITSVRQLLHGGGASLRQAIMLQEILGTPVSLKDD